MALVTLPYPNMDFVPLDILTANELDQLVANIEAVNNAQIGASQISNGSITSAKIDGSSFSRMTVRLSADIATTTTNATISLGTLGGSTGTQLSQSGGGIKIGSGVSMVRVSASVFFNASSRPYGWFDLRKNGNATGYECIANIYSDSFCSGTLASIILPVAENDVITLYNKEGGTSIRASATYLTVEVIA